MVESVIRLSRADVIESTKRRRMINSVAPIELEDKENVRAPAPSISTHFKKRVIEHPVYIRKSPRITRVSKGDIKRTEKELKSFNQRLRESKSKAKEVEEPIVTVFPEVLAAEPIETLELPPTITQRRGRKSKKSSETPGVIVETSEVMAQLSPTLTEPSAEPVAQSINTPPEESKQFSPFAEAKRAFHRSGSFKIVGRVEEKAAFSSFWYDSVAVRKGASIYISGNPGTGKTALVDEMLNELVESDGSIKLIKMNCMMLKDPLKAFNEIAANLELSDREANPFLTLSLLEQKLTSFEDQKFYVIVVDEIDQIGMKDSELLCKLLAIPFLPNARACLIGIANSIDLTERFLPRLKMLNCEPQVLHFSQYTIPDVAAILTDRLERINELEAFKQRPFIDRVAIEFTARKVASTGDLRRALDMIRQSIDLAEEESLADPAGSFVKIKHVAKIVEKFGSGQSGPLLVLKALNLHQKVILAAFLSLKREGANAATVSNTPNKKQHAQAITPQRLFDAYCAASLRPPRLYEPVTRSEFVDLMSNLESMSVIGRTGQDVWGCKVYLIVPAELVLQMLEELNTIKVLFGI